MKHSITLAPAKAPQRAVRASRTVEVGREWRVGTRSGFGRPGGPGFFGGAVAVPNCARGTRVLSSLTGEFN